MTNSQQMTDKQAAQLFLELLTNDAPLYEVQPDPGKGATIKTGRFTESRLKGVPLPKVHARIVSTSVEPAEKTPTEAMAIPAIREAHKRVRKAVADDGDLIAVLDKLATVRAAAERQRARYDAVKRLNEQRRNELREAGISPDEIEAVAYRNGHDLMSGLVRTLALLAACDFVETWYLETGDLPSRMDAEAAFGGTRNRYDRCRALIAAFNDTNRQVNSTSDLWRLVDDADAEATRKAVGRAFEDANVDHPDNAVDVISSLSALVNAYDANR